MTTEPFIERLECPECGIPADTHLFPVAVRYHGKGCSATHKPVKVRYYRERKRTPAEATARYFAKVHEIDDHHGCTHAPSKAERDEGQA